MQMPIALAILALILIPFVPSLLRIRIRFLRWVHWDWAANVHEKYFEGLVLGIRIGLCMVIMVLLYLGL